MGARLRFWAEDTDCLGLALVEGKLRDNSVDPCAREEPVSAAELRQCGSQRSLIRPNDWREQQGFGNLVVIARIAAGSAARNDSDP